MSTNNLRLQVILQTIDKASAVLRRIQGGSADAAHALKGTRDRLNELNKTQKSIADFRELRAGLRGTTQELKAANDKVKTLASGLHASGPPTQAMIQEFSKAKAAADALGKKFNSQSKQLKTMQDGMTAAGISTRNMGAHQRQMRGEIERTTNSIDEQKAKLKLLAIQERSRQAASAKLHAGMGLAGGVAAKGAASAGAGMGLLYGLHIPIEESKKYQTETMRIASLGLGDKVSADAVKFAQGMETYGTSARDNLQLVRDGMTAFADLHHAEMVAPTLARMKFANEAFYGEEQGAENEKKFMDMLKVIELRGGLASEESFKAQANIIQRVITATGGRVQGEEWLNVIKTGGVAAKGLSDEAMYYQLEPLVQEMGGHRVGTSLMSAYQNIYQGKTTVRAARKMESLGLIADQSKVKHDKVGQVSQMDVGALKGSDIFRENQFKWMEEILLPALAAKGITEKQGILDAMGGIFSNRTASNLFAQMYMQREQIHKNAKLNAGADGIDSLFDKAKGITGGAELELAARRANLYKAMGDSIMPAYTKALEVATSAIQGLTRWMAENPRTAQVMMTTLGILAVGMVALGGLLLVIAPMIAGFVMMRYVLALVGIQGGVLALAMRGWAAGAGVLRMLFSALFSVLSKNPLVMLALGIAGFAASIIANWGNITAAFKAGDWAGIGRYILHALEAGLNVATLGLYGVFRSICGGAWELVKSIFGEGLNWLGQLGLRMYNAGADMMRGLANGITGGLVAVKDSIVGAGSAALGWFKEKLGIKSPSRVFMLAGSEVSAGAALGISRGYGRVRQAAAGLGLAAAGALPMASIATPLRLDTPTLQGTSKMSGGYARPQKSTVSPTLVTAGTVASAATPLRLDTSTLQGTSSTIAGLGAIRSSIASTNMQALSISSGYARIRKATAGLSLAAIGAMPLATGAAPLRMDTRPPLSAAGAGASMPASAAPSTISITIHAAPGMDVQALARAVSAELDKRERQKRAAGRSSLSDLN